MCDKNDWKIKQKKKKLKNLISNSKKVKKIAEKTEKWWYYLSVINFFHDIVKKSTSNDIDTIKISKHCNCGWSSPFIHPISSTYLIIFLKQIKFILSTCSFNTKMIFFSIYLTQMFYTWYMKGWSCNLVSHWTN